jgi:hypothetical protein
MDQLDKMIAYEAGELHFDETIEFFQELIDSGLVWHLQGSYGRAARALIDEGWCVQ